MRPPCGQGVQEWPPAHTQSAGGRNHERSPGMAETYPFHVSLCNRRSAYPASRHISYTCDRQQQRSYTAPALPANSYLLALLSLPAKAHIRSRSANETCALLKAVEAKILWWFTRQARSTQQQQQDNHLLSPSSVSVKRRRKWSCPYIKYLCGYAVFFGKYPG